MQSGIIWPGKKPRLKMSKLYQPIDRGGLAVPSVLLYDASTPPPSMPHGGSIGFLIGFLIMVVKLLTPSSVCAWTITSLTWY